MPDAVAQCGDENAVVYETNLGEAAFFTTFIPATQSLLISAEFVKVVKAQDYEAEIFVIDSCGYKSEKLIVMLRLKDGSNFG